MHQRTHKDIYIFKRKYHTHSLSHLRSHLYLKSINISAKHNSIEFKLLRKEEVAAATKNHTFLVQYHLFYAQTHRCCTARYCAIVCMALKLEWINHKKMIKWKRNGKENRRISKQQTEDAIALAHIHLLHIENQSEWMNERKNKHTMHGWKWDQQQINESIQLLFVCFSFFLSRCMHFVAPTKKKISPIKVKWNCCIRFTWCLNITLAIWFVINCYYF